MRHGLPEQHMLSKKELYLSPCFVVIIGMCQKRRLQSVCDSSHTMIPLFIEPKLGLSIDIPTLANHKNRIII
jgi:hypothetical protein